MSIAVDDLDVLSREQVCGLLKIRPTSLWKLDKTGDLKPFRIGRRVLYHRVDLIKFVQRQRRHAGKN